MYLLIGGSGFLGRYLIKNILNETTDSIIATDRTPQTSDNPRLHWEKCDICDMADIERLNKICAAEENLKVVFLAAYHHPDLVMKNPKTAWQVNVICLAEFLNRMDNIKTLYYPSTEVVYGQGIDGYRFKEDDALHPANRYGAHKTVAERMVNVAGFNAVRFPVLMGPSLVPGKKHFYDEIVETVKNGGTMEMFEDQKRSMLDFDTAAKMLIKLIETPDARQYPIVNICGDEALSKYELGKRIARRHGLDENKIIPIRMDDDSKIFAAKRAKETLLDNSLLKKILGLTELKIKV